MIDLIISASLGCKAKVKISIFLLLNIKIIFIDSKYSIFISTFLYGCDITRNEKNIK